MTNKSNIPAPKKAPLTAKRKQPSRMEVIRSAAAKVKLAAANAAAKTDIEKARADYITGHEGQAKRARVYAHMLNDRFAEQMREFKCHWTAFTTANCRTDNEKAILAAINGEREKVKEIAKAKCPSNPDKPWSDIRLTSKKLWQGGEKRERVAKPLDEKLRAGLAKIYRDAMKEDRPTVLECDVTFAIGALLQQHFKVDISKLG